MKKYNSFKKVILSTFTASVLIGCGGGGGSSSPSGPSSTSFGGSVIDGYIKNATVCLDLDLNSTCDDGEPSSTTNSQGEYSLNVTVEQQNHVNFNKAPIIASGGVDIDTGKNFEGKLEAPKNSSGTNITPITTLVSKMVKTEINKSTSSLDKNAIETIISNKKDSVKKVLGISDVDVDFVASKDKDINKAALQIQKTAELLAQASNGGNTSSSDVFDKVIETFADKIDDLDVTGDNTKFNIDSLVDETIIEVSKSGSKIRTLTGKVLTTNVTDEIKKVSKNIDQAFDKMQQGSGESYEDLVDKIIVLVENQVNTLESAIENDTIDDVQIDDYSDNGFDDSVFQKSKDDFRIDGLEYELNFLGVSDSRNQAIALAAITDPKIYPHNIYEVFQNDDYSTIHAQFEEIKNKVEEYFSKIEQKEKEEEILTKKEFISLTGIEKFYDFYEETDWNNEIQDIESSPTYSFISFDITNNTFENKEYKFKNNNWVLDNEDDDSDVVLYNNNWVKENSNNSFTINDDNSINLPIFFEKAAIISSIDLSGKKVFVPFINSEVNMPSGANEYLLKLERSEDSYSLYENVKDYRSSALTDITSFSELLSANCEKYTFLGDKANTKGIAFKGEISGDENSCNSTATSGELVEIKYSDGSVSDENAGSWSIKQIQGKEILVVKPTNSTKYSWDGTVEYTIFSSYDDGNGASLFRGDMEPKGEVEKLITYNEVAASEIATSIETYNNNLSTKDSYFYALGKKWKNYKGDANPKYTVVGNVAKKDSISDTILINANKLQEIDSRAEARIEFFTPKSEISAQIRFKSSNSTSRGQMMTVMKNIDSSDNRIYASIQLRHGKIVYYVGKYDSLGNNTVDNEEYFGEIVTTNTTFDSASEAKFVANIKVEGSTVIFLVKKINGSTEEVLETYAQKEVSLSPSYDLGIDRLQFRSELRLSSDTLENGETFETLVPTKFRVHKVKTVDKIFVEPVPSFISGKEFVYINPNELIEMYAKFNPDNTYYEYGEEGATTIEKWECNGFWKDLGNNKIAVSCEEVSTAPVKPDGNIENDDEIIFTFSSNTLKDGDSLKVTEQVEGSSSETIDLLGGTINICVPDDKCLDKIKENDIEVVANHTTAELRSFVSVGDEWYDKVTISGNSLSGLEYYYDDISKKYIQDGSFNLTVSNGDNAYKLNFKESTTFEEGVLEILKTEKVNKIGDNTYTNLYKITATNTITKEATNLEWFRWPSFVNISSDVNSLKNAFLDDNASFYTFSEKYDVILLRADNKVVKGINIGSKDNAQFERSNEEVGSWIISGNEIILTLDKEKVYLRVVNDGGSTYIENTNKLGVGFVLSEILYTGTDIDTFIDQEIKTIK